MHLSGLFDEVMLEQIPRENNEKADPLAKMASSLHSWKTREIVVQVELTPSTELIPEAQEESDWRKELLGYMEKGELSRDPKKSIPVETEELSLCDGGRNSLQEVLLAGYFWPTILNDALALVISCESCQWHSRLQHQPAALMKGIVAACPFDQWGIDIVGSFPPAPAQKKFLLVAIEYFSKWVEAEALARITEGEVLKFLWKNTVCSNGQVEVTNRSLVQSLKTRLGKAQGNWVEELSSVLWSFRTTPRIGTGETPFILVYGNEAVLQVEIGEESARIIFYDEKNGERRMEDLEFLKEKREAAAIRMEAYKSRIARSYNHQVHRKGFQVGDLVLSRVQDAVVGKLDPKWEGPYKVVMRLSSDAYYLEDSNGKMLKRPWSAYNLRKYYS
ncbi:uncharacterized protein [Henckelia pumila]|uniref:uncharacterized protein n=1 Tax=Henckelia pumila TaxID=405737 RepID=UPI003C6DEAF5